MQNAPNGLTSTQKGKVTEHLVASALVIASNGRLAPFVAFADDHGIDLIVLDKVKRRTIAIQVKSAIKGDKRGTVQFDVRKATPAHGTDGYLALVQLNPGTLGLGKSWLNPMAEVPNVAIVQTEKFALVPSVGDGSGDRYRRYRFDDARALAAGVLRLLGDAA